MKCDNGEIKNQMFFAISNGIIVDGKHIPQVYACYIDDEYCVVDMQNDNYYLLKDYGKTWSLN